MLAPFFAWLVAKWNFGVSYPNFGMCQAWVGPAPSTLALRSIGLLRLPSVFCENLASLLWVPNIDTLANSQTFFTKNVTSLCGLIQYIGHGCSIFTINSEKMMIMSVSASNFPTWPMINKHREFHATVLETWVDSLVCYFFECKKGFTLI